MDSLVIGFVVGILLFVAGIAFGVALSYYMECRGYSSERGQ